MRGKFDSPNWGGARKGAGRPRKEPSEQLVIRVPAGSRAILKFRSEALGYKSISAYVIDLINKDVLRRLK